MNRKSLWFPLFLLVGILFSFGVNAQNYELGFGVGTFNYFGDLAYTYNLRTLRPAAQVHYRYSLSESISFRTAVTGGYIAGNDQVNPIDAFAIARDSSYNFAGSTSAFSVFLFEISGTIEYHFMNWRDLKTPIQWTPYLFAGVAIFGLSGEGEKSAEYSSIQPAIPFGGGVKWIMNPRWYLGFEIGLRKTFFDYLDNISFGDIQDKDYQYGNLNDNDHFVFTGITITYSFYSIPCPSNPYSVGFRR